MEVPVLWLYRRDAVAPLPGMSIAHVRARFLRPVQQRLPDHAAATTACPPTRSLVLLLLLLLLLQVWSMLDLDDTWLRFQSSRAAVAAAVDAAVAAKRCSAADAEHLLDVLQVRGGG
jgi:hypothetical protein